ncbi:MAG: acyltransferase domain-containing protein [Xenococcaceae cyanobacterium MO_167.B27]|nr:acyltransferase domain-containing protein [Xenococcaceae cyanobacterium MO_167.B27]
MQNLNIQKTEHPHKVGWVFPGQGSQKLGMGLDLLVYPFARDRLRQAKQILGWSVSEVCQNKAQLSCTLYTQPCLYLVETLLADIMKKEGYQPNIVAGYSLGEYAAIYTAGALDFEIGLHLIKRRGEIMNRAPKGAMVALIGFNLKQLEQQICQTPNVWRINDDSTVAIISGTFEAVESLLDKVKVRRMIRLKVSCAFHTPLMEAAAAEFQEILESISFDPLKVPVVSSTDLVPTVEITRLKKNLIRQISQPVKWRAISDLIAGQGTKEVVEIAPGSDLIKQMKRVCPELSFTHISNLRTIQSRKQCINALLSA